VIELDQTLVFNQIVGVVFMIIQLEVGLLVSSAHLGVFTLIIFMEKNRYNNQKEKVLRYGELHDHCRLVSCLLEHHQRLDHGVK